jgi:hypothetical protein
MLNGIASRLNAAILLTGHQSKSTDGTTLRLASGSTAWINSCRSVLTLSEGEGDDVMLCLKKANHARAGQQVPLVWRDAVLLPDAAEDALEKRIRKQRMDKAIFEEVAAAWRDDMPLSAATQAQHRYLPEALARKYGHRKSELREAMLDHIAANRLGEGQRTSKTPRGLRVISKPIWINLAEKGLED